MKSLNIYIIEKFKINSKTINTEYNLDNIKPSEGRLSDEEMDILDKYFNDHCTNIQKINKTKKGLFHIFFDNNLKFRFHQQCKLSIVKSPRFNGGYGILVYKANHSIQYEFGQKNKKGTKEPLLANIKEVIEALNKKFLNGDWAESIGAKLKTN